MFDPKKYDTRMPDPEGKRKKLSGKEAHRHLPKEAKLRRRPDTRYDEKRAEESLPKTEKAGSRRSTSGTWRYVAVAGLLVLIIWRFAVGEVGQGLVLLILGASGFFWLGTGRRRVASGRAPAPKHTPLPPRPGVSQPRVSQPRVSQPSVSQPVRQRRAAPKPTPTRARKRSVGERISAWVIFGVLSSLVTSAIGVSKACKPDREPPRHRTIRMPDLPTVTTLPLRTTPSRWRAHLPSAAPDRISGAVLFGGGHAVEHVDLVLSPSDERSVLGRTDEHGVFVFDDIGSPSARVEVRSDIHFSAHAQDARHLKTGVRGAEIHLSPHHTLLLRFDALQGRAAGEDAFVQVAATNARAHEYGTWPAACATALVTGLRPAGFYDVLVQVPHPGRSALVERVAPGQQVVVELQPSTTAFGHVELPAGASPDDLEVELTHGWLRIQARVSGSDWRADHLPRGSWWDVTAQCTGGLDVRTTTQTGIHAGGDTPVVLDLR